MLIKKDVIDQSPEQRRVHQFNDGAVRHSRSLSDLTGLERLGVHLVRLEKGYASSTLHFHENEEEFVYILSGAGVAEIGDERVDVAAGDFMGFTAPSAPHNLHNPHDEDLVYLVGGEHALFDVVQYPKADRTLIKQKGSRRWLKTSDLNDG